MRKKLAQNPLIRPVESRPLRSAPVSLGLPTADSIRRALQASLVVGLALAAGCADEAPEIHKDRIVVVRPPVKTSTQEGSKPASGNIEVNPTPEDPITPPTPTPTAKPKPIKHVPPTPTSVPVPGGMKAPMIAPPPPAPTTAATMKPYAPPIAPSATPPKLGGEAMPTTPGSI